MLESTVGTPDWSALPQPRDDGAARHLVGLRLPCMPLPATDGSLVDLSTFPGRLVVYAYPRTGRPGVENPDGWDAIPGARGCTPQSCAFRDHAADLAALGVDHLFGLSTQQPADQREVATRLHLPFRILSDAELRFARALRLPMFETGGLFLLKRLTMIVDEGVITHVFYPVFPPDRNAQDVMTWLSARRAMA